MEFFYLNGWDWLLKVKSEIFCEIFFIFIFLKGKFGMEFKKSIMFIEKF